MRILAVDLSAMFRRNWEASQGRELSQAFERTVSAVAAEREGYDRVAICCDAGPSFRKVIEPGYKAKREKPPASYGEQLRRTIERLAADGCAIFRAPPIDMASKGGPAEGLFAEADDVIASLVAWATSTAGDVEPHAVRILGGDKDFLQLVDDARGVEVKRPTDDGPMRVADVVAKLGIVPAQVPLWLALAGDSSDEFKPYAGWGVVDDKTGKPVNKPGIGDKGAIDLIKTHRDLAGIFAALTTDPPGITGHVAEVLKRHGIEAGIRGLELATLRRDLPIDFDAMLAEPVVQPVATGGDEPYFESAPPTPAAPPPDVRESTVVTSEPSAPPSTALARVAPTVAAIDRLAFQPRDLSQLWDTARAIFNSRVYAKKFPNAEAVMAVAIDANERGISLGAAMRNAHVINGQVGWSAGMMAGMVKASGLVRYFDLMETTWESATVEFQRAHSGEVVRYTAHIADARDKGYFEQGAVWKKDAKSMLVAMAYRECARQHFPEIAANTYTPDELRGRADIEDAEYEVIK